MPISVKFLKSFQSSLTLAGYIVILFGTAGAIAANLADSNRNQKSDLGYFGNKQGFSGPTQSVFEPFFRNSAKKKPRFLTSLFNSDTMKSAPQVMCELISANEPGPSSSTLNDYKYLVKEFLRGEASDEVDDDKKQKQTAKYRSNDSKTKSKQKISKKKKNDSDSSSEETSASVPSGEKKRNGLAELMDLEEEEAIDNKAIDDMIGDDPDDFVFALADTRQKHRLHQLASNRLNDAKKRFRRNVEILEKTLIENRKPNIFRASRAIQNLILERKARELDKTNNTMDRLRIAAEVGSVTRSGRQCRALFDTSSCSVNTEGIQGLVQNVRKAISGGGTATSDRKAELIMQDVKTLLKEAREQQLAQAQSANNDHFIAKSSPDVKVVLNIGGPSPQQMQEASMLSGSYHQAQPMYWPQLPPTSPTTPPLSIAPPKIPPKMGKQSNNKNDTRHHSNWPKLKVSNTKNPVTNIDQVVEKSEGSLKDKNLRDQYKVKLQQAANILRLPWGLPKNSTTTKRKSALKPTHSKAKPNVKFPTKTKFPKLGNSLESDSDSLESSEEEDGEELGNIDVLSMQNNLLTSPWPGLPTSKQNFYRGLQNSHETGFHNSGGVIASVPAFSSQRHNDFRQRATGSSLVSNVYDIFFRKVLPLPHHSSEWIPSALRHGRRNQVRRNYQRFDDSSSPPHSRIIPFPHPNRYTHIDRENVRPKERPQFVKSANNSPLFKPTPYQTKTKHFVRNRRRNTHE